jgi:Ca2+-binding EF-hand superfamily protein
MTKKWLAGSALGGFIIAGSVALAATAGHGPMHFDADANKDGNLTKAELTAALDQRFAQLDSNNDGRITKEERDAARKARFEQHFKAMDTDGNGQISQAEMQAAHAAREEMRGAHRGMQHGDGQHGDGHWGRRHGGFSHGGFGHGMAKADANNDGVVTKAEFQARALERFAKADANNDGSVTKAEREAARGMMKRSPKPAN